MLYLEDKIKLFTFSDKLIKSKSVFLLISFPFTNTAWGCRDRREREGWVVKWRF